MAIYSRSYRLKSFFGATLLFIAAFLAFPGTASAQTRIISLSGDLDFGRVPFHSSSQRMLAISNLGDSVLTVSNLNFPAVPLWGQGSFQGNWSGTIPPNSTQFVPITFTPIGPAIDGDTNDVDLQGYLNVDSDATAGANYYFLSGIGTWLPPSAGGKVNFGSWPFGSSTATMLTLTNIGNTPIYISNVFVPDGFFCGFSGTIEAGAAASLFVGFNPEAVTNYVGIASVSSDATDPVLVLVTPSGNVTNTPSGFNGFSVSGTGTYPTGNFIGLFMPSNSPAFTNSGYISATISAKGKLRATITLAGKQYPFSAQFSPSGSASAIIARKNLPNLNVSLQLSDGVIHFNQNFTRDLTGTVDNGAWTANLSAVRAQVLPKNVLRAVGRGTYSFTIAGNTNALIAPAAPGSGTIAVRLSAVTRVTGKLGDGTRFSQNTILSGTALPLYVPLYGNRGAILGWIAFGRPSPPPPSIIPLATIAYDIVGSVDWFKPAGIDPNYPDGFSFQTSVSGSVP